MVEVWASCIQLRSVGTLMGQAIMQENGIPEMPRTLLRHRKLVLKDYI